MAELEKQDLEVLQPASHPSLEVFVVLKRVFRYFSDSELRLIRLVSRYWNFTAMSELVRRHYAPPPVKIGSPSSNQLNADDYLNFENQRRQMWADLYGTDCSMIEFRNLHLIFPLEHETLYKIFLQSWLSSVTSLTLSDMKTSECTKLLLDWILAGFPNLLEFNCFVTSKGNLVSDFDQLKIIEASEAGENSLKSLKSSDLNLSQNQLSKYPNLKEALVCIEEDCDFPWSVFDASSELQNLELRFGDAASLMKAAEGLDCAISPRTVQNFIIALIRAPIFEEQVRQEDLHTESFAVANAKFCNHFLSQSSLSFDTLLPAASIFVFLKSLNPSSATKSAIHITAPYDKEPNGHELRRTFTTYLVPEIGFRFVQLKDFELKFLQYETETPFVIPSIETLKFHPNDLRKLKTLIIRTWPLHDKSGLSTWYEYPDYGLNLLEHSGFQLINHLVFEVSRDGQMLYALQIAALNSIRVKKLVLQGAHDVNVCPLYTCACVLFPDVCPRLPDDWAWGRMHFNSTYEGLLGIDSLEEFCLERIAVTYLPKIEEEIYKAPSLKRIYLDASFKDNFVERTVVPADVASEANANTHTGGEGPLIFEWPSQIGFVEVVAIPTNLTIL